MKIVDRKNFKIIVVTDPDSCEQYFPDRLALLAACGADAVILRAKKLNSEEYRRTASVASTIFDDRIRPRIILHNHIEAEDESGLDEIHMSLPRLESLSDREKDRLSSFRRVGVSVHSPEEAVRAVREGADYLVYGHVFETACKPGLPPRGVVGLGETVNAVSVPVYGIGGINSDNIKQLIGVGAAGACVMSAFMTCDDPAKLTMQLKDALI